jgi:hypothetical protein
MMPQNLRASFATVLIVTACARPAAAQPSFVITDRESVARGPTIATTGAFGGTGEPGVAVASFWVDEVTVFPTISNGMLGEPSNLSIGRNLRGVAAVDLNSDGLDDLVVADEAGGSRDAVLYSFVNAGGAFVAPSELVIETTVVQSMRTGNFDGIEPLDIATANGRLGSVSIVYGRGLQLVPSGNIFLAGVVNDLAAIDFDADGLEDLAVLTTIDDTRSAVTTLHSESVGFTLRPPTTDLDVAGVRMTRGDYDGDGAFDLAVIAPGPTNTQYRVRLLLSRQPLPPAGQPLFEVESWTFPCPPDERGGISRCTLLDVVSADFDRNDVHDLAISMPEPGVVAILPRDLLGTFGTVSYLGFSGRPRGLAAGDVSGDQVEDIVVTEFTDDAISLAVSVVPIRHPVGAACTTGIECETGACVDQVCCLEVQCSLSERCDITDHRGSCTRPLPPGSVCEKHEDCRSAMCSALSPAAGVCLRGPVLDVCPGDCDENEVITVDEILVVIRIALGEADLRSCASADTSDDGQITVEEIIATVDRALDGCPI